MSKPVSKPKSAMDKLVDSFHDLREEARKRMSPEEFRRAEKKFDEVVNKVRARAPHVAKPHNPGFQLLLPDLWLKCLHCCNEVSLGSILHREG
jgi:hypothetical protein